MSRLNFYLRYSLRSLRRDSTRTFLAGLSVTFGVLSLIAMQLLAHALLHGAMFDQRIQYGGDAQIQPENEGQGFNPNDLAQIETWRQQGLIADYSAVSTGSAQYMRTSTNGRVNFLAYALGIDPASYPLTGDLVLREPAGANAAEVLKNPKDTLITRDLADKLSLHVGDSILLSGDSAPIQLTVTGIVGATPAQQGDAVFYSLETARLVENRDDVINTISVNWGSVPNADQTIIDSPYRVFVAASRDGAVQSSSGLELFDMMLKGAGVLGLLVGGLSVSNTLQVILARRKLEIAMLKTLGYQQIDLLILISLETGLIGLIGGVIGALIGSAIAGKLIDTLSISGSLMLDWHPDPVIVIGGVVVGVLTAVVFGMQAILTGSATRPVELLRDLPLKTSTRIQVGRTGIFALMLIVFGILVGIVLGSPLEGILYIFGGGIILVLVRAVFWAMLWVLLKLPVPRFPMLRLARANLRQHKTQASLVVLALFAGAFSVTFAALAIYNAQSTVTRVHGSDTGYNLMIYTAANGTTEAITKMNEQGSQGTYVSQRIDGTLNGNPVTIEGRDVPDIDKDMHYAGTWTGDENTILMPQAKAGDYSVGETLTLSLNRKEIKVTLAGFYEVDPNSMFLQPAPIIVSTEILQGLGDAYLQTRVTGMFPVNSLSRVTTALGQALPTMLVFSRADVNDAMTAVFQTLFTFAVSIAGLAFVAGAVLIANATGLTMVERRREIGLFKAVGYTSGHILRVMLSEYGFLGLLGGLFGTLGSALAITVINLTQPGARLVVEPLIVSVMLVLSVGIAVVSAALVAWQPTRVRPLDVLRYE
ncbi:MAG: FtsX-like permease family protein [Anaerolineae bacterium]|nr:FtsX-like permease family protein [Anaerolineae bacterium]